MRSRGRLRNVASHGVSVSSAARALLRLSLEAPEKFLQGMLEGGGGLLGGVRVRVCCGFREKRYGSRGFKFLVG